MKETDDIKQAKANLANKLQGVIAKIQRTEFLVTKLKKEKEELEGLLDSITKFEKAFPADLFTASEPANTYSKPAKKHTKADINWTELMTGIFNNSPEKWYLSKEIHKIICPRETDKDEIRKQKIAINMTAVALAKKGVIVIEPLPKGMKGGRFRYKKKAA